MKPASRCRSSCSVSPVHHSAANRTTISQWLKRVGPSQILIRALASANQLGHDSVSSREGHDSDFDAARQVQYILSNETLHLGLPTERLISTLLKAVEDGTDPMTLTLSEGDRRILATTLMQETEELTPEAIEGAFASLRERRLKSRRDQLLSELVAAERKGDAASLSRLTMEKMQLGRELQEMQNAGD